MVRPARGVPVRPHLRDIPLRPPHHLVSPPTASGVADRDEEVICLLRVPCAVRALEQRREERGRHCVRRYVLPPIPERVARPPPHPAQLCQGIHACRQLVNVNARDFAAAWQFRPLVGAVEAPVRRHAPAEPLLALPTPQAVARARRAHQRLALVAYIASEARAGAGDAAATFMARRRAVEQRRSLAWDAARADGHELVLVPQTKRDGALCGI